jgi:23S rRNA (cytidine1920-2'-O)/16S rRNA (cytidine1409-2'-O)-methyltransferase
VTSRPRRVRLDHLLVDRGLAPNRIRAQALLLGGQVRVGDGDSARRDRKPGDLVDEAVTIVVRGPEPYVSRGGHKLSTALDTFAIDPAGLVCLDVGASTGGFTDVLLQRRAARVYALDVGRGQLAEQLRADPRVISLERTNARRLAPDTLPEPVHLAVIDVSFISLAKVLGPIASTFDDTVGGRIVPLVKPQFEIGRGGAARGVVRDPEAHMAVLERVSAEAVALGLLLRGVVASPILGPEGNREFFLDLEVPSGWGQAAGPTEPPPGWSERLAEVAGATVGVR